MKRDSLALRLGLGLSLGLVICLLLQWLLVSSLLRELSETFVGSRLGHDAESLLAALELSPEGLPLLDPVRLNPTFARPFSGHYYQLRYQGIELSSRSLWQQRLPLREGPPGESRLHVTGPQGQPLLVLQRRLLLEDEPLLLAVAEDLSPLQAALERFDRSFTLLSLLGLGLLLGLQAWLIRRLLAPLRRTGAEIAALRQQSDAEAERFRLDEAVPREIRPLVQSFNQLLGQQQQRLTRSRHALDDLSHALKQPLTRIRQLLEGRPWPELAAEVDGMRQRVERQLARARQAGVRPLQAGLSLQALLDELLPVLRQLYADKTLDFELVLRPDPQLRLDRQDALELLGNLLDNACKWARSRVRVEAGRDGDGLWLEIRDDGPGVPPDLLQQLSRRGVRADQLMPGHGLGLAIASDLIQGYGGTLELSSVPGAGFCVRLHLPEALLADPASAHDRA